MIKKLFFAPILLLSLLFIGCMEDRITRKLSSLETIAVEYKTSSKDVEARFMEISPSEDVNILSEAERKDEEPIMHRLSLEFTNPEVFPENDSILDARMKAIQEEAILSIDNIEEYRKLVILFQEEVEEDDLLKSRSIRKVVNIGEAE